MQFLMKYEWPGNVRQLRNCIEGMVVMTRRPSLLDVDDFPKHIVGGMKAVALRSSLDIKDFERMGRAGDDSWQVNIHVGMSVKDAERELIAETLKYTNNNKALAAKILDMGLRTLFRKVKEYEID
jgi:DNA-binding NtrC family response regulator